MSRMVKDFIEIADFTSLDNIIEQLNEVRASLGEAADPQVKMRGDDIFGRHLCVSFFRPQTAEEAECDARYASAFREARDQEIQRQHDETGYCPIPHRRPGMLRIVA